MAGSPEGQRVAAQAALRKRSVAVMHNTMVGPPVFLRALLTAQGLRVQMLRFRLQLDAHWWSAHWLASWAAPRSPESRGAAGMPPLCAAWHSAYHTLQRALLGLA